MPIRTREELEARLKEIEEEVRTLRKAFVSLTKRGKNFVKVGVQKQDVDQAEAIRKKLGLSA